MVESDVLVIGAGAAGCACALKAADLGLDVVLLSHLSPPEEGSNTSWAQGGIAYQGPADIADPELLASDMQQAGGQICRDEALSLLSSRGPELVEELLIDRCEVPFDRDASGELHLTEEAAHSCRRILQIGRAHV